MNDDDARIAVLENEIANIKENHAEKIGDLEKNQRWLVIAIVGAFLKSLFDLLKEGAQ